MELPDNLLPLPDAPEGYRWEYIGCEPLQKKFGTFCFLHILPEKRKDHWHISDTQGCWQSGRYHIARLFPVGKPEPKYSLQERRSFTEMRWGKKYVGTIEGTKWSDDEQAWFYMFNIGSQYHRVMAIEAEIE